MPGSVASRFSASRSRASRSTPATCVMYESRTKYVIFKLKQNSRAGGAAGNRWKVLLYRSATNRFSVRLVDPEGTILATVTSSTGAAACATAVNANAAISPFMTMQIVGTISSDADFSSSITDYCKFSGGS